MKFNMNTIIQHSANLEIATKIATKYDCDFKRYNSHIRLHADQQIDLDELHLIFRKSLYLLATWIQL